MYPRLSLPVFGFHATERKVAEQAIAGALMLAPSENSYDWLGHGIYFWENSYQRAREYADVQVRRRQLKDPVVLGAVLDLGLCLDLTDVAGIQELVDAHAFFDSLCGTLNLSRPKNKGFKVGGEKLIRELDCGVFNTLHHMRGLDKKQPYDTVRAVFTEGERAYPGAFFQKLTHVQIAVLNANNIKGFFWPRESLDDGYVVRPTFESFWKAKGRRDGRKKGK
jgi:hypothetical protein